MKLLYRFNFGLLAASLVAIAGCAPNPMHKDAQRVSLQCPASHTMVCESNGIGRIRHGTFSSSNDRCACVPENTNAIESPVIPTIQ